MGVGDARGEKHAQHVKGPPARRVGGLVVYIGVNLVLSSVFC